MTDAERITDLEKRLGELERSNKIMARDNRALAQKITRLEAQIADPPEPPALKGWWFENFPDGKQKITPIQ